ncbi:MAG: thioredoxin family protein [bacterium]|nr:thioredoxin family protein [bacterium]
MPRPPILPLIEWPAVFAGAVDFEIWLKQGENPDHQDKMEEARRALVLPSHVEAFLQALPRPVHVLAIAEDWCGDVVRHVPVLQRLADAAPNLRVRFIARGPAREVFVRFLTNDGEAIPKFIFLSDQFVECGNWGPMPEACRRLIARGKALGDPRTARERVSALYSADPGCLETRRELLELIELASTTAL